jgi:hypothetical protein
MTKLITGNMSRGAAPHAQDDRKAQSQFDQFTADGLELLTNAFTVAEAVEGEIYGKVAYVVLGQKLTDLFNKNIQQRADVKRLRVLTMVSLAMTGRPVFKNFAETANGMTAEEAETWFAESVAKGRTVLNRLENWFKRGVRVANLASKQKGGLVACYQSASNQNNLVSFLAFAAPFIQQVLNDIQAEKKKSDKGAPDLVATVTKYLGDKPMSSNQIALVLAYLNEAHSAAVNLEAAAEARRLAAETGADDEEEEYAEAA